jgi:hypothetical protein
MPTSTSIATVIIVAVASCGSDPEMNTDASVPDASPCTKPKLFINGLASGPETYHRGADNSETNTTPVLMADAVLGPSAMNRVPVLIATLDALLAPLGIEVTNADPGAAPHLELVLVGSGWPFPADQFGISALHCQFNPKGVALLNASISDRDLAKIALLTFGQLNGLEPTSLAGNCLDFGASPSGCTFSNGVPIAQSTCGVTMNDQLVTLQNNLGCP